MQLHWLFLSLYNQQQSGCDRMSFTHSVAAFFAFLGLFGKCGGCSYKKLLALVIEIASAILFSQ